MRLRSIFLLSVMNAADTTAAAATTGEEQQQIMFPIGPCSDPLSQTVYDGPTCHRLCHQDNLTTGCDGTYPDQELDCTYESDGPNQTHACEDAKLVVFSECQHSLPSSGPYDRTQCVCGGDDAIVACDSDYYRDYPGDDNPFSRRPPLECESINITDLESCIDVATSGGTDWYCNKSSTPCDLKYEAVGDYMMCTKKWGPDGGPNVICGDACAWTPSGGSYTSGMEFGALGVAIAASIGTVLVL